MTNLIGGPVVRELLRIATSAEQPVIENTAIAKGFLWRCSPRAGTYAGTTIAGCGRVNGDDQAYCPGCGGVRKA